MQHLFMKQLFGKSAKKTSTASLHRASRNNFVQQRTLATAGGEKLFDKILIANRGEITVRVIKTCKELGIKTVAIYSEPDMLTKAVRMADEAYCVGPAASKQSYLRIDNIMEVIRKTGTQAVHPGYGFLSENFKFCEALDKEGVAFIGPGVHAISAMGDKIESKQLAMDAKVNTIPGCQDIMQTEKQVLEVCRKVGYPVMIKASGGGGGKGMRVAYNDEEAKMGYRLSKEEALSSFGDDRMFVEKFIEDPRHIEIQLLADKHGNICPFPERECSIQRRNQKVIEEAPSTLLDDKTRIAMGKQAAMLARAVGYHSAGTVEFLCDKKRNFYFLEMNTRLQVEHPVTEEVSGVDLVHQMIRIAAGHKLPDHLCQGPLPIKGWAMESRVYAEDPLRGFLPSIGRLVKYNEPVHLPGVRCDSGVAEGSDISMFYDPMISKLITHGKDRNECLQRMRVALNNYEIIGPGHNLSFLQDVYRHPRFVAGKITTKFIPEEYPNGFSGVVLTPKERSEMASAAVVMHLQKSETNKTTSGTLETSYEKSFTNVVKSSTGRTFVIHKEQNEKIPTVICDDDGSMEELLTDLNQTCSQKLANFFVGIDGGFGETKSVRAARLSFSAVEELGSSIFVSFDGDAKDYVLIDDVEWEVDGTIFVSSMNGKKVSVKNIEKRPEGYKLVLEGAIHDVVVRSPKDQELYKHMKPKEKLDTSRLILCPMPGVIISVAVEVGQEVEIGQEIAVVEAMKMQNVLRSERKGKVVAVKCKAGASMMADDIIVEFE